MNIKFNNKKIFEYFRNNSIVEISIGSHVYGTNHENSDHDIMIITYDNDFEKNSLFSNHHQLQYTENNTDFIITSLSNFIKNIITGDSTINFEVINDERLLQTPLSFLHENKKLFYKYNILRSYLGLARRDLKEISKTKDQDKILKRFKHIYRGLYFFDQIYEGKELNLKLPEYCIYHNGTYSKNTFNKFINNRRNNLNCNNDFIDNKLLTVDEQILIDNFIKSFSYKIIDLPKEIKELYYQSNIKLDY